MNIVYFQTLRYMWSDGGCAGSSWEHAKRGANMARRRGGSVWDRHSVSTRDEAVVALGTYFPFLIVVEIIIKPKTF
jgi:hypothetical protein